jgi:glycosyltransferase involved in cell wall biosynthesis
VNIAHVVESLEVGGAEVLVATLCRLQRAAGDDVAVHCLSQIGPVAKQLEHDGVTVHVHAGLSNWRQVGSLFRAFRQSRRQVIHCHNVAATIFGAFAGRLAGAEAIISTRHGSISPVGKRRWLSGVAARICDFTVAVGEPTHRVLASEWGSAPDKVVTIRNGAFPARLEPGSAIGAGKMGFTAITVARLKPPKDPATLLRAIALASVEVPDLHLWVVGDGILMPELRTLASELGVAKRTSFLGEREDVGTLLSAADVFVLSSMSEGVPVSLIEAMAAKLPFIVTNVGGMPEIAQMSGAGIVVEAGDAQTMARALVQYANKRNELPKLGEAANQCYEQHFRPESWAGAYLELYGRAGAARRASRFLTPAVGPPPAPPGNEIQQGKC